MKVANTSICIIIVCLCVFAVSGSIILSKDKDRDSEGRNMLANNVPAKDMGVRILMSHGPLKDGLAAFLICEQKKFKIGQPVPLLYGVVYSGPGQYTTIPALVGAVDPGNMSWLSITGADGKDVPYVAAHPTFPRFNPKDALRLRRGYFHGRLDSSIRDDFKLLIPGLYTIRWHYQMGPSSYLDAPGADDSRWLGHLVSNEIQIEIVRSFSVSKPAQDDATQPVDKFIAKFSRQMKHRKKDITVDQKQALREVYPLLVEASKDEFVSKYFWAIVNQSEPKTIEWKEAEQLILKGKVFSGFQLHSNHVGLTTVSGEQYDTKQPRGDEVFRIGRIVDPKGVFMTIGTE